MTSDGIHAAAYIIIVVFGPMEGPRVILLLDASQAPPIPSPRAAPESVARRSL